MVRDKDEPSVELAEVDVEEADLRRPSGVTIDVPMTVATFRCVGCRAAQDRQAHTRPALPLLLASRVELRHRYMQACTV